MNLNQNSHMWPVLDSTTLEPCDSQGGLQNCRMHIPHSALAMQKLRPRPRLAESKSDFTCTLKFKKNCSRISH